VTGPGADGARLERREWTRGALEEMALRYRTWGQWGEDDELGAANHITPAVVARAAGLVRRGAVFSLALPMDRTGPQTGVNGRVNPQHVMLKDGGDILAVPPEPGELRATDDAVYMPLQSSTQWDALCHVFYNGQTYNGRGPESVGSQGARFNSITNLRDRAVGRGVLLDVPRMLGRPWLDPGESIQAEHLERCAQAQGVEIGQGDFVLVRTGQMAACRAAGAWGDYAGGPAPGLGVSAADFLCPRGVVGVAADTWGIEALPYETSDVRAPLHVVLLVNAGVYIGEMWDMEALAEDCAADAVYEFMLTAAPLTITGAVGSPVNPVVVK
jgi:kynurenine formamidase